MHRIGVISDTHGQLDPRVHAAFAGVDLIVHAGDIGHMVIEELETIAPVVAVLGNNDTWDFDLPLEERFEVEGVSFLAVHEPRHIRPPVADVTIHGHTHVAEVERTAEGLRVNPGSPARPRGAKGRSVAIIEVEDRRVVSARILELDSLPDQ